MRKNLDVIASLNMIGEGGPVFLTDEEIDEEKDTTQAEAAKTQKHN